MENYTSYTEGEVSRLGHFFHHFAVGDSPFSVRMPDGLYRTCLRDEGYWHRTFRDRILRIAISPDDCARYCSERSQKKLGQTPAQFYLAVDEAIDESRISSARIAKTINGLIGDVEDMPRKIDALEGILFPVYIILRNWGYVEADLCR